MSQFLNNVQGVDGYLIFSMTIFISFFLGLLIWVYKADNKYIRKMKNLPLENNNK